MIREIIPPMHMCRWQTMGVDMTVSKRSRTPNLKSQRGIALLETTPLIVIFAMLLSFGLGMFGVIHTAVLHSISARAYAFETFRQRTNLYFFREDGTGLSSPLNYTKKGWRYHAIQAPGLKGFFYPTTRQISLAMPTPSAGVDNTSIHDVAIYNLQPRNDRVAVNPVWVMVGYGMCLNMACGN